MDLKFYSCFVYNLALLVLGGRALDFRHLILVGDLLSVFWVELDGVVLVIHNKKKS